MGTKKKPPIDFDRIDNLLDKHSVSFGYLFWRTIPAAQERARQVIGFIVGNRSVRDSIFGVIQEAVEQEGFGIPFEQQAGFRRLAADYVGKLNEVDRHGKQIPKKKR